MWANLTLEGKTSDPSKLKVEFTYSKQQLQVQTKHGKPPVRFRDSPVLASTDQIWMVS